ncbi:MAG: cysteine hydrolase, partial [Gammaproteobacteria bacterium]
MSGFKVAAEPYGWPFNGTVAPSQVALVIIDMQHDFCGPGGYVDVMGYDVSLTRGAVEPIRCTLDLVRKVPGMH